MDDDKYQLIGLIGFIIAGMLFVAVGVKYGDGLTIAGSVVWILSCIVWMIPLIRSK